MTMPTASPRWPAAAAAARRWRLAAAAAAARRWRLAAAAAAARRWRRRSWPCRRTPGAAGRCCRWARRRGPAGGGGHELLEHRDSVVRAHVGTLRVLHDDRGHQLRVVGGNHADEARGVALVAAATVVHPVGRPGLAAHLVARDIRVVGRALLADDALHHLQHLLGGLGLHDLGRGRLGRRDLLPLSSIVAAMSLGCTRTPSLAIVWNTDVICSALKDRPCPNDSVGKVESVHSSIGGT